MRCDTPHYVKVKGHLNDVPVPCGRCPNCKKARVSQWVFRMQQEDLNSFSSYFVTLTYDTSNVPITPHGYMSLEKKDFQLFMKRLRKLQDSKIRYYAVGEYGSRTMRPHYHAIMFNVEDKQHIVDAWSLSGNQIGTVHIGSVSGASIAYTTKYIDKPSRIPMHQHDDRIPEFSLMSKGIGKSYLTDPVKRYHKLNLDRNYVLGSSGHKIPMPKYYRDKILTDDEKERQRSIIRLAVSKYDHLHKIRFDRLYGDRMDYDHYLISEKYGRYAQFYNSFKNRDLL